MQKQTTLANELWPLLLPRITSLLAGAGAGSAGGSGAVAEHDLGGAKHTGALRNDQGPQFLLLDGTRQLEGNLAVAAGITIDGVDLSAHVLLPDVHHARATAGTLISISGQQVSVANGSAQYQVISTGASPFTPAYTALSGFAGDGMSFTGGKYVVGQGAGVTVSSTTVALTTPGTLSVSSANAASGNHTHAITASSNPGAAAALLATTAAGLLTLKTLDVTDYLYVDGTLDFGTNSVQEGASYLSFLGSKPLSFNQQLRAAGWSLNEAGSFAAVTAAFTGNVDITNGGDLYVAGSGFYAGNPVIFADSSGGNVGILCVPDPQFALDVAGPARAQYFIGPHAIQLKNAVLIAHYDGPERGPLGEANGHMGQVAAISGDVVHRLGKFNKAIEVSSSYTNLVGNPSFEAGVTGWSSYSTGTAAGSRARTQEEAWDGYYSYRMSKTSGASADRYGVSFAYSVTSGQAYSLSVRVKVTEATGVIGNLVTFRTETNVDAQFTTYSTPDNEWVELTLTTTGTATGTATAYIWLANCSTAVVYVDALQITATGAQRPFWAGGARAAGTLTYSNLAVNWNKCTIMAWFRAEENASALGRQLRLFEVRFDASNTYRVGINNATNMLVGYLAGGGVNTGPTGITTVTPRAWHHVALVVNGTSIALYLDGVAEDTNNTLAVSATGAAMAYVGCGFAGDQINGLIDEFAIINDALDAAGVLAVYESNAPVFAESSVWSWRATPKGLVWADDEGLWMRDVAGLPVLGVYGGEAATKTWGGFTDMAVGDVIIGYNTSSGSGSAALRWTKATGKFGWYGGGSATPKTEIGTDGAITATSATLSGSITAMSGSIAGVLSIGADGAVLAGTPGGARVEMRSTQLAGYNSSNLRQWWGDTSDGSFNAGNGALKIDSAGIQQTIANEWSDIGAYRFTVSNKTIESGVYGQYDSSISTLQTRLRSASAAVDNTSALLSARCNKDDDSTATAIMEVSNLSYSANVSLGVAGTSIPVFRVTGACMGIGAASPVLKLQVLGSIGVGGDEGGVTGYTTLTNAANTTVSTGTGTVKMNAGTARNSDAWIKVYIGTTTYWIPAWSNIN